MRLAFMVYGHLGLISGGFLYDRILVDYLGRRGVKVEVVTLPWRQFPGGGLLGNFAPDLLRRLKGLKADLVVQDELAHPSLILGNRLLGRRPSLPIVSLVHNLRSSEAHPPVRKWLYRQMERLYLTGVRGFIYSSEATRQSVEALVGRGRPGVVAYPGGNRFTRSLTREEILARCRKSGPLRLIFLGSVIPRKGLHILLEALESLPPEGWCLTVVGQLDWNPAYVAAIRKRICQQGWALKVKFTGLLIGEEVGYHLARSDLLVVPSFYEGFGMAYLEGMAFGLPAVATSAGGARELITPGKDGFLLTPGDARTLARHLETLMRDRRLLCQMSLAARERYERHPTWEESCEAIFRFLKEMRG